MSSILKKIARQKRHLAVLKQGQEALENHLCPYCNKRLDGVQFGGSEGRSGGLASCVSCGLRFSWFDNPFECHEEGV